MATISLNARSTSGGLRLTRRGRLSLTLAAMLASVVGLLMVASAAFGGAEPIQTRHVVVHSGDTLWSIARAAAPEADPRGTIEAVRDMNNLSADAPLVPGQLLTLPAAG